MDVRTVDFRKYRTLTVLALTVTVLLIAAGSAIAGTSTSDPRVCSFNNRPQCARAAAKLVARRFLEKKTGGSYIWQGPMTCIRAGSILRWSCSFTSSYKQLPSSGHVLVVYRALSAGWTVSARVTP